MIAEAIMCLALNVYYEARSEDMAGQIAVSQVVMNRVHSEYYPDTPCEVVYQGPTRPQWDDPTKQIPVKHRCQFSWYCDGKSDNPTDEEAWRTAVTVAWGVFNGMVQDKVNGALWYHADYVTPEWASEKQETTRVGTHIFYSWKK